MADLTQELALLNQQAAELLKKYDQAFARLDEKSQEYAKQLADQIVKYLGQIDYAKDAQIAHTQMCKQAMTTMEKVNEMLAKVDKQLNVSKKSE